MQNCCNMKEDGNIASLLRKLAAKKIASSSTDAVAGGSSGGAPSSDPSMDPTTDASTQEQVLTFHLQILPWIPRPMPQE
uniref:Uncharacterized protein n=1 Tax=Arundo donax TaxID=35708 RepID=A0A0A9EL07_ARUDO